MELTVKDIMSDKHFSECIWVCDYIFRSYGDKAIRNIRPVKCSVPKLGKFQSQYNIKFYVVNKDGKISNKNNPLFCNTIYPKPLKMFTTEEAKTCYSDLCIVHAQGIKEYIKTFTIELEGRIEAVIKGII
jgi:hypothetical protein